MNCIKLGQDCGGYDLKLSFDIDDDRNKNRIDKDGNFVSCFVGKPRRRNTTPSPTHKCRNDPKITLHSEHMNETLQRGVANVNTIDSSLPSIVIGPKTSHLNEEPLTTVSSALDSFLNVQNYSTETGNTIQYLNIFESNFDLNVLSNSEENELLKHFFTVLVPLLDANPDPPWPKVILRYCTFQVARSCFIALAFIHVHAHKRDDHSCYRKGITHLNVTLEYLIEHINQSTELCLNGNEQEIELKDFSTSSNIILALIYVNVLFEVLEGGKSYNSRQLFRMFSTIVQNRVFSDMLLRDKNLQTIVVTLSWYDTISAIVSYDCRLPFCDTLWYSFEDDKINTGNIMGCPAEIFTVLSKVCSLRHELKRNSNDRSNLLNDFDALELELLAYRRYVPVDQEYPTKLKTAQCWALAVYVVLLKTTQAEEYHAPIIKALIHEFVDLYQTIDKKHPIFLQMVWPLYVMGCECQNVKEREKIMSFVTGLQSMVHVGTLDTLQDILNLIWEKGISSQEALHQNSSPDFDYLPL